MQTSVEDTQRQPDCDPNQESEHLVFVYGTLKTDYSNNRYLVRNNATLIGLAHTGPEYRLFARPGSYPYLAPVMGSSLQNEMGVEVQGEVWRVSEECLQQLDVLEGHPNYYTRTRIAVTLNSATISIALVWAYVMYSLDRASLTQLEDWGACWNPHK